VNARPARWETLAGALAVLAWLIAVLIVEGSGDTGDETAADLLAYFEDEEGTLYVGGLIFFIGSALMIWFGGVVRSAIAAAGLDRLAAVAMGSAVALAVTSMGLIAPQLGAAFGAGESDTPLSEEAAQALWYAGDGFVAASSVAAASLVAATGLAILRTRLLPSWLGWLSLLVGLALIVPFVHWAALFFAFPIWVLLVTWFLWTRADETPPPAPVTTTALE
jgi:hypothetical protein